MSNTVPSHARPTGAPFTPTLPAIPAQPQPADEPIPYRLTDAALLLPTACAPWCTSPDPQGHEACEGSDAPLPLAGQGNALHAYLFRFDGRAPVLAVYSDETIAADLDVAGVDELIADVEAFLPQLRAMRAQLAAETEAGR
ncbi:DUF6907 domain-containing protein [Streptomyces wuyuanensis]|uniref:DUF6907 domain-containing protein n=1 Tax=Streptomyces wuyuanensis TaxID=1196353 RepID=UPI0037B70E79